MKISATTLYQIQQNGLIPSPLQDGWENASKKLLGDSLSGRNCFNTMAEVLFVGFVIVGGMILFQLPNTANFYEEARSLVMISGFCMLFCKCLQIWTRSEHRFSKDLENLRRALGSNLKAILQESEMGKLVDRVDEELVFIAKGILRNERMHGINSKQALHHRKNFDRAWKACRKFSLADEKWNRYFEIAEHLIEQEIQKENQLNEAAAPENAPESSEPAEKATQPQ